jgi:hypothetical protein
MKIQGFNIPIEKLLDPNCPMFTTNWIPDGERPQDLERKTLPYEVAPLDPQIRPLVYVLNEIRGVHTMQCCEGHRDRDKWKNWYVSFYVEQNKHGWKALELLSRFVYMYELLHKRRIIRLIPNRERP